MSWPNARWHLQGVNFRLVSHASLVSSWDRLLRSYLAGFWFFLCSTVAKQLEYEPEIFIAWYLKAESTIIHVKHESTIIHTESWVNNVVNLLVIQNFTPWQTLHVSVLVGPRILLTACCGIDGELLKTLCF